MYSIRSIEVISPRIIFLLICFLFGFSMFNVVILINIIDLKSKSKNTSESVIQEELNYKLDDLISRFQAKEEFEYHIATTPDEPLRQITFWPGNRPLNYRNFIYTINHVIDNYDFPSPVKDRNGFIQLLLETAATESFFGSRVTQIKGPALGVFQIEPKTHIDILKNYKPFNQVTLFADKNHNNNFNLKYNLPYQIAMAITYYSRFDVHTKDLSNIETRASIYKKLWNTNLGKGSVARYIEDSEKIN